ncbi:ATP-dependent Clp protease ATP-binding subunit ClpX [Flavobacteriales bacterium]|nr:ATP-dependent Clp protease ATP-binding subunit ClpX [Flavobacteriales bacterium]
MSESNLVNCSFCVRKKAEVDMLIAGVTGHICNNCVEQATEIVKEELEDKVKDELSNQMTLLKPKEIYDHLSEYVIGQDEAKRVLSVAVYNHYKRLLQTGNDEDIEIQKSNVIMVGETGTGKTLLAKSIAKMLNVPFCIADATVLTEAGYVGEDVESILSRLLQAADYDVESAQRGIVFIDEIDKVARKSDNPSITRDVSGEGVQQAMLKLLEGSVVNCPPQGGRKHPEQKLVAVDTKDILFICGGAFAGIEKKIEGRMKAQSIGYSSSASNRDLDKSNMLKYVAPQDLKSFGLIPELLGRLPIVTHLNPLDEKALRRILTEPKNALVKQYMHLFQIDGIELSFEKEVFDLIVEKAMEYKLGARGLRGICEAMMLDAMFDLEGQTEGKLNISLAYAKEKLELFEDNVLKVA